MKTSELVFIGINGSVVALHRATGEQVWATSLKGSSFVNVVVEGGSVFATCYGEIFCLDPVTGGVLWHNRLKGFGTGLAAIATAAGARNSLAAVLAQEEEQRRAQAAAAASAAT